MPTSPEVPMQGLHLQKFWAWPKQPTIATLSSVSITGVPNEAWNSGQRNIRLPNLARPGQPIRKSEERPVRCYHIPLALPVAGAGMCTRFDTRLSLCMTENQSMHDGGAMPHRATTAHALAHLGLFVTCGTAPGLAVNRVKAGSGGSPDGGALGLFMCTTRTGR